MCVNTFNYSGGGHGCTLEVAKNGICIWQVRRMDDVFFQHDDACATCCSCCVVVCMPFAHQVVLGKVGGVTAKNYAITAFAWADGEWLEEFLHGAIILYL